MEELVKSLSAHFAFLFALFLSAGAFPQNINIENTFGGDTSSMSGKDFLVFDRDGKKEDAHISDRMQLDFNSSMLDARIRMDFDASENKSGKPTFQQTQGFVNFCPLDFLNFTLGNEFFYRWSRPSSYFAVAGDSLLTGRLAGDGGAALVFDWANLILAAGLGAESDYEWNFGAGYTIPELLDLSVAAHNVTDEGRIISAYAGLLAFQNFTLNLGYSYNYNGGWMINSRHAAQASLSLAFEAVPLYLAADGMLGLTEEYYDYGAENYADYVDSDGKSFKPFFLAFLEQLNATDFLILACSQAFYTSEKGVHEIYVNPYFECLTSFGEFRFGAKIFSDDKNGYKGFSIPFSWKYKLRLQA